MHDGRRPGIVSLPATATGPTMSRLDPTRWNRLWQQLGATAPTDSFEHLLAAYSAPDRAYHSDAHIAACLAHFDTWQHLAEHPHLVELALWTHDLVYDTRRQDNEAASAEQAVAWLEAAGLGHHGEAIRALILATCHQAPPQGADAGLVVDLDLSILAAPPPVYDAYETAIRQEYHWVPEPLFRAGRSKLLKQLLAHPALYHNAPLAERWEQPARQNLQRALLALDAE